MRRLASMKISSRSKAKMAKNMAKRQSAVIGENGVKMKMRRKQCENESWRRSWRKISQRGESQSEMAA